LRGGDDDRSREFHDGLILLRPAARIAALALLKTPLRSWHGGCSVAATLSDHDMEDLAAYYASLK
jgi:cytochrome c553